MIVKPTVNELLKHAENRYSLVIATSKRARQIANGAPVKTDVKEESPVTLAANEIAEGKIKIIEPDEKEKNKNYGKKTYHLTCRRFSCWKRNCIRYINKRIKLWYL